MRKAEFLKLWQGIEKNQEIKIAAVPYKHSGSTYAEDGIRITGSQPFIESVLSRFTDLLAHENGNTRLQVNFQESKDRQTQRPLGSFNCYVQVHERGGEAKMVNAMFGRKNVIPSRGY